MLCGDSRSPRMAVRPTSGVVAVEFPTPDDKIARRPGAPGRRPPTARGEPFGRAVASARSGTNARSCRFRLHNYPGCDAFRASAGESTPQGWMEMGGVVSGAEQSRRGLGDSDGDESAV